MSPDDPRHGTYAGHLAHVRAGTPRCEPCDEARYRYQARTAYRLDNGIRNRIPLGQAAWDVLERHSCTQIANQTGLNRNMLYRIHKGGPDRIVLRATRDRILSVRTYTPAGIVRRLQALAAIGYSATHIAGLMGCHYVNVCEARRREEPVFVRTEFAEKIVAIYDDLHMQPLDPSNDRFVSRQINQARRNGWLPPLAWDDIDSDPEPAKVTDKKRDTLAEYEFLRSCGESHAQALGQLGITEDGLQVAQRRAKAVA